MKKIPLYWRIILILFLIAALSAVPALFPSACDWYVSHLCVHVNNVIMHITSPVPFSLGECAVCLGVLMLIGSILLLLLLLFLRKKEKYRKFCGGWFKTFLMMTVCAGVILIPTYLLPCRSHVLGASRSAMRTEFNDQELISLYRYLLTQRNQAAEEAEIAPDGTVHFYSDEEMLPLLHDALRARADDYPQLSGYYPRVKCAALSDIYSRMNIGGMMQPLALEPTYNKYESPTYQPVLRAHEISHTKGFIKENEANYIAMTALAESPDPLLRFSAYQDMIRYVHDKWEEAATRILLEMQEHGEIQMPEVPQIHSGMTPEEKRAVRDAVLEVNRIAREVFDLPEASERVKAINRAGEEIRETVYAEDPHPIDGMSSSVQEAVQTANETYWSAYRAYMKENSYEGVVLLLLQDFDGTLY